ncbi:hypothetical protein OH492_12400 [Vibrio chagasii]|nr:hypothetical protein [Vibrio chagasii]
MNEGAGYRNTLGYFVFDTNNPPVTKDDINAQCRVFPNTSIADVGEMQEGDSIDLSVQLRRVKHWAFFIISNGWGWEDLITTSRGLVAGATFSTAIQRLTLEASADNRRHNVAFPIRYRECEFWYLALRIFIVQLETTILMI